MIQALAAGMADEEEDPTFEEENEEIGGGAEGGQGKRKRLFCKELQCMMYGFGDDQNPYTESVDILEDLVIEFITEMTHKAMSIGRQGRVQVEDIVFLIRKDPRKFARVKDLLTMNEELKRARKAFDELWILTFFVLSEVSLFSGEIIFNNYIFHSKVLISSHVNEK
ncbi:transcription initiation factor TFIID subunit 13-like [Orcinus orca]|uniref:transcription initiation factor TFIID subunit 13-like n=1 Tax=Orcinus orca TaxID=9733 RepID=UPI001441BD62|nr:transcription initiation factor TFIID subunit 13-like [Orcinus orca]